MRNTIIRFVSLYVFNVVVLLIVGLVLPTVTVGWHALWAAVVLTLAALFVKPALRKLLGNVAKAGQKVVQYALIFVVELAIWLLTVWFSGVNVSGWFWGYVLPPLFLLIAWVIYDQVDDRIQATAGQVYDKVSGSEQAPTAASTSSTPSSAPSAAPEPVAPEVQAAREELKDGITPEQKRMLDDL